MEFTSWLAEAPQFSGTYAVKDGTYTLAVDKAIKFHTKDLCQAWCDAHTKDDGTVKWEPREHVWMD